MAPGDLRYPKYDLEQSVEVARHIASRGAGATVSGHELAAMLDYSGTKNGAYLNRVAAARLFGLIDGQTDAISITERAERVIHPDYPETSDRARLEAFRDVPLYEAFLDAFRGRLLPDTEGMANTLVGRFKVPAEEAGKVVGRLLLSAEQAGLFRVGGHSRLIEPTYSAPSSADSTLGVGSAAASSPVVAVSPDPTSRRFPKIIDGALDLMPAGPPWDEAEYREWLSFFDQACRVYYRIARGVSRET